MVAKTSPSPSSQSQRKVVHALIDNNLQFATAQAALGAWLGVGSLLGRYLADVLPELRGREEEIQKLYAADVLVVSNIHRYTMEGEEIYFDLQIESAISEAGMLVLTLIDVTEQIRGQAYIEQMSERDERYHSHNNGFKVAELEQHNRNLYLLNQASRTLVTTLEKQAVLNRLMQVATELINVKGSSIWLWDSEAKEQMVCQAVHHPEEAPALLNQRLQRGQGVGGTGRFKIGPNHHCARHPSRCSFLPRHRSAYRRHYHLSHGCAFAIS